MFIMIKSLYCFVFSMFYWIYVESVCCKPNSIMILGNFSVSDVNFNIALMDSSARIWATIKQPSLYLYGESTGLVIDAVRNETKTGDEVLFVGSFDTPNPLSQLQYCSVARWENEEIMEIGNELCPRMGGPHFEISLIELGSNGDVFIGGPFESRVWDGGEFVNVVGIARYDAASGLWLPLQQGKGLSSSVGPLIVNGLSWDKELEVLIIGGQFDQIRSHSAGCLAIWSAQSGLTVFPGGYLSSSINGSQPIVHHMTWISDSKLLVVTGNFDMINDIFNCLFVAIYVWTTDTWICLYAHNEVAIIDDCTSIAISNDGLLFISGWINSQNSYQIASANISNIVHTTAKISHALSGKASLRPNSADNCSSLACLNAELDEIVQNIDKTINWQLLDGFPGCDGPILDILPGEGDFANYLLITGQFRSLSSMQAWSLKTKSFDMEISSQTVQGVVSKILQVQMPVKPTPAPSAPHMGSKDDDDDIMPIVRHDNHDGVSNIMIVAIFVVILAGGVMIGFSINLIARSWRRQAYKKIDDNDNPSLNSSSDSENKKRPGLNLSRISVTDHFHVSLNLSEIYDRALKSRYLESDISVQLTRIEADQISLVNVIGEGSFGRVWSGYWRNSQVAIKEFLFAQAAITNGSLHSGRILEEIIGEAALLSSLRHPKVLQVYGVTLTAQALWIISDLCSKGSLRSLLDDDNASLKDIEKLSLAIDIAEAMTYLHTRNPVIIHRDLKSFNIFVHETISGSYVCKVGDWGSARALDLIGSEDRRRSMTQGVGTACWLAPEVIQNALFSRKSDVYGFGIVVWELATRREVYPDLSAAQIIVKVASEGLRPPVDDSIKCAWIIVAQNCWAEKPDDRPEFSEILSQLTSFYKDFKSKIADRHQNST